MKFLAGLAEKYKELDLKSPRWVNEITTPPVPAATTATTPVAQPATPTPGQSTSVVSALMNAMNVIGDDPDLQKVKATVSQKVTDAKKQITDTGAKVVSTIDKALADIGKLTSTTGTSPSTPTTSTPSATGPITR